MSETTTLIPEGGPGEKEEGDEERRDKGKDGCRVRGNGEG